MVTIAEWNSEEFRQRIRKMTDEKLLQMGKAARYMADPLNSADKRTVRPVYVTQLQLCREEWRKRHPKLTTPPEEAAMKLTIMFFGILLLAFGISAQTVRSIHVTKVTLTDWKQETLDNGNTSSKRKFVVDAHDAKNNYEAECEEWIIMSGDKVALHTLCVQPEAGEDYDAKFYPSSFSFVCDKCVDTEKEKYSGYTIRLQEERQSH